ncbi:MAG TPA: tyrosine--tRNA ligase [Pseudomonadales bacterium]
MTHTSQFDLLADLTARALVSQMTSPEALAEHLREPRTLYCGFDPTAESLHIGSLVPLLALRRFQLAGHRPLALVGGATGLVGDPSFKAIERRLNTPDVVAGWSDSLKVQISRFLDFDSGSCAAQMVNNLDWMQGMGVLDFLRDVGKHFSVNAMIQKESVRQRIEREGEGISYTEFTYMILQSYDFAELNRRHGCTLQIGGSDQWGNITGGIDLTRRLNQSQVYGLTLPLVTKADGSKFGKTEAGTIWLDATKTSPYAFYQFWINTADADAYRFLRYFTFLSIDEIAAIERADAASSGRRQVQSVLAREVTRLVHGEVGVQAAERISQALFSGQMGDLSEADYQQLSRDGMPNTVIDVAMLAGKPWTGFLVECGMAGSGKQVQDALKQGALLVNGEPVSADGNMKLAENLQPNRALFGRYFLVRLGKKKYHLLHLA